MVLYHHLRWHTSIGHRSKVVSVLWVWVRSHYRPYIGGHSTDLDAMLSSLSIGILVTVTCDLHQYQTIYQYFIATMPNMVSLRDNQSTKIKNEEKISPKPNISSGRFIRQPPRNPHGRECPVCPPPLRSKLSTAQVILEVQIWNFSEQRHVSTITSQLDTFPSLWGPQSPLEGQSGSQCPADWPCYKFWQN